MDEPQVEFMTVLCDLIKEKLGLSVRLDETLESGGLYAESGAPALQATYQDKTCLWKVPVLFMSKRADQRQGLEELSKICRMLHYLKVYPDGKSYGWADASIATPANKIGRSEDGQYLHSCIVNCLICF